MLKILNSWASIIDVWAMLYCFVVSVQIGIRLRLEHTTRGLWVLYLLSLYAFRVFLCSNFPLTNGW